jgi:glycosyltransferase involved in cell wall biosynthesis
VLLDLAAGCPAHRTVPHRKAGETFVTVLVSVVVPTFRRPELLNRCLAALVRQNFDPAAYEIIVVDDAVCPDTKHLIESWAACVETEPVWPDGRQLPQVAHVPPLLAFSPARQPEYAEQVSVQPVAVRDELFWSDNLAFYKKPVGPRLRYVTTAGARGPAAARNQGWQLALGQIIAFTDDDCIPQADWLSTGVAIFASETVIGVTGRIVVPLPPVPTDYERDTAGLERAVFATANCFYRRSALAAVGGFDERFRIAWREDSDLFFTMLEHAKEHRPSAGLVRAPQAVVVHPVRQVPWGISLKQQRKSMFNALLYKKHPRLYRQSIQARPPWHYYASVAALLFGGLSAWLGATGWAIGAAVVWLVLTGWFCTRRLQGTARAPAHVMEMAVTSILIPPLSIFWRLVGAVRFRVVFL